MKLLAGTIVLALTYLPFEIASARLFASFRPFPTFSAQSNIKALFSPAERSHPFKTLYTPSRLLVSLVPSVVAVFAGEPIVNLALRFPTGQRRLVRAAAEVAITLLVYVPGNVLALRLNVQRETAGKAIDVAQETSVTLREAPYADLQDCVQKTVEEEGWSTLWRAWPIDVGMVLLLNWMGKHNDALEAATGAVIRAGQNNKDL